MADRAGPGPPQVSVGGAWTAGPATPAALARRKATSEAGRVAKPVACGGWGGGRGHGGCKAVAGPLGAQKRSGRAPRPVPPPACARSPPPPPPAAPGGCLHSLFVRRPCPVSRARRTLCTFMLWDVFEAGQHPRGGAGTCWTRAHSDRPIIALRSRWGIQVWRLAEATWDPLLYTPVLIEFLLNYDCKMVPSAFCRLDFETCRAQENARLRQPRVQRPCPG